MEEAVTRKFVHADSSHIISFCGECLCVSQINKQSNTQTTTNDAFVHRMRRSFTTTHNKC